MIVYINGRLLHLSEARISPLDYGFMYGFSLFETLRSYGGRLFRLSEHLSRLRNRAAFLGITKMPDNAEIDKAIRQVLQGNNLKDARIRLTFSAGEGSLSPDPSSCIQPILLIAASAFTPPDNNSYEKGYRAIVSEYRRDSLSPLSRIKSGNYLISLLSSSEAKQKGAQVAVLLNEQGSLSECSMANIFLVKNKVIITPDEKSGILPGIARQEILRISRNLGLKVEEREIKLEELFQAEEAFITSSLLEIMPLAQIDGRISGKGLRGDITKKLHTAYKEAVDRDAV